MNPAAASNEFQVLQGTTQKFYKKLMPDHLTRNDLACSQIGGAIAEWKTIVAERLPITSLTMTDDSFFVGRHYVRCDFGNVQKSMFACIDHILNISAT